MVIDVSLLIVSHNTCDLLDACLDSIQSETRRAYEIIVVDNASDDGSAAMVRRRYPDVMLIENQCNAGFAAANNQAARHTRGRTLLLLNPDTLVLEGAVDRLAAFMDANPDVGICGPRVLNREGRIAQSCYRFPTLGNSLRLPLGYTPIRWLLRRNKGRRYNLAVEQPQPVEAVQGCALAIRADLWHRMGGLDETFFLYGEDTDLCYRTWQAGRRVTYLPQACIVHFGGASAEAAGATMLGDKIGEDFLRSRYCFLAKTRGRWAAAAFQLLSMLTGLGLLLATSFPFASGRHKQLHAVGTIFLRTGRTAARRVVDTRDSGMPC